MKCKQILVGGVIAGIVIEIITLAFLCLNQTIWQYNVLELAGMRTVDLREGVTI